MSYKVLEQNGVENENVDGGAFNRLAAGGRDGIVKGVNNECELQNIGNTIVIKSGLILVCGVRIKFTSMTTLKLSDAAPTSEISYQIIAQVKRRGGEISAEVFLREKAPLIQEEIYAGVAGGTYQVEIGVFTHLTNGSIINLQRTLELIGDKPAPSAAPMVEGVVYGETDAGKDNTAIGRKCTALGYDVQSGNGQNVVVGYEAAADLFNVVAVGYQADAEDMYAIAIGSEAQAWAENSIQIGKGKNTTLDTLQICDKNIYDIANNRLSVDRVDAQAIAAENGVFDGGSRVFSPNNRPPYPVTSVNGKTGDVVVSGGGGGSSGMPPVYISMANVSETYDETDAVFALKVYDESGILAVGDLLEICEAKGKIRKHKDAAGNVLRQTRGKKIRPFMWKTLQDEDLIHIRKGEWLTFAVNKDGEGSPFPKTDRLTRDCTKAELAIGVIIKYFRIVRRDPEEAYIGSPRKLLSNVLCVPYRATTVGDRWIIRLV